jgi:hypothetical protein
MGYQLDDVIDMMCDSALGLCVAILISVYFFLLPPLVSFKVALERCFLSCRRCRRRPFPQARRAFPCIHPIHPGFQRCGGRDALVGLTTTDVCEHFIKPFTLASSSSYCDLLKADNDPHVLDTANVFISPS